MAVKPFLIGSGLGDFFGMAFAGSVCAGVMEVATTEVFPAVSLLLNWNLPLGVVCKGSTPFLSALTDLFCLSDSTSSCFRFTPATPFVGVSLNRSAALFGFSVPWLVVAGFDVSASRV